MENTTRRQWLGFDSRLIDKRWHLLLTVGICFYLTGSRTQAMIVERVSVSSEGVEGNAGSGCRGSVAINADGQLLAFSSDASNLVSDDTNGKRDVFVRDRQAHTTERISVSNTGEQGNGDSGPEISISADGRFVAFVSSASNLVVGDTNDCVDVFVFDRQTDAIERASISSSGQQGNGSCSAPAISSDGRYIALSSSASNLAPGDTNGTDDIFVYDRQTHTTERVSVSSTGEQGNNASHYPGISSDGCYVAFHSVATNLVVGDTNKADDIFVYDRQTHTTERISVSSSGEQGNADSGFNVSVRLSSNGRFVVFVSLASNLVAGDTNKNWDLFVRDRRKAPRNG